jgi:hypothetical protein
VVCLDPFPLKTFKQLLFRSPAELVYSVIYVTTRSEARATERLTVG